MKKIKITVMRIVEHKDLMEKYENPMEMPCMMKEGQVFIADGWKRPVSFYIEVIEDDAEQQVLGDKEM